MTPHRPQPVPARSRRRRWWTLAAAAAILSGGLAWAVLGALAGERPESRPAPVPTATTAVPTPSPTPAPTTPDFDKAARSIDDPASIWVVVDKLRPLDPLGFVPPDLVTANVPYAANATMRAEAAEALERMFAAAAAEGAGGMMVQNGYRSYETQVGVFAGHVQRLGQAQADIASARPGHSEHQTGLAADIMPDTGECPVDECFADTSQGRWLADNAWRFGYHLRYPEGMTPITGYAFEPWHYRYIGVDLSTELRDRGVVTLEQFFDLPAAPTYG